MCIFPEGTFSQGESEPDMLPFHEGSFRSAFSTESPIVPVTFVHTDDIFEKHLPFVKATDVTVVFGKPVPTKGLSRQEHKAVSAAVREEIEKTYFQYA